MGNKPKSRISLSITISTVSFYLFLYVFITTWHKYGTNDIGDLYYYMSNLEDIIIC